MNSCIRSLIALTISVLTAATTLADAPHNLILFAPDGLRAQNVDPTTAPTMSRLREEGVNFRSSHSLFPTFTASNASAFATGHGLGDTGDFSSAIDSRLPFQSTVTPFLENDVAFRELNMHLGDNYLKEPSIFAAAAALPDPSQISTALKGTGTLILDDSTGQASKNIPIPHDWRKLIEDLQIKPVNAPSRGDNGIPSTFLQHRTVGNQTYRDAARFPGRTVGLQ